VPAEFVDEQTRITERETGTDMAKFVVFFNYTAETWSKMISTPSDRLAAVREMAQTVGGDVESLYFMFGAKDGFVIVDVPDAAAAAAVAIAVSSTGAVQNLETHELIAPADLGGVLERAGTARSGYRPPGT
jgi:uncharacterized protein with GYD domain